MLQSRLASRKGEQWDLGLAPVRFQENTARALTEQLRHIGQGGLSWLLRSYPHLDRCPGSGLTFLTVQETFDSGHTIGLAASYQVKNNLCSVRRIVCCTDVILALTRRDLLLFWV